MCGPFALNPLSTPLITSPLQIAYSRTGKPRVVVNVSAPHNSSVNSGIPRHTYLQEPFVLRLPGLDALLSIIRQKGQGCHVFKKDLSRAYRQLSIDPRDYNFIGLQHNGSLYFDIAPPFGLRSAAMMCQRTTSAVTYMYKQLGFDCTNYIDDFGGAEVPENSNKAFNALGTLFSDLGLDSSPDKDSPPSTQMVFLGIHIDTSAMTTTITSERLEELIGQCTALVTASHVSRTDLRCLHGVMSFVTACVRPARLFMNALLNALRDAPNARAFQLTAEMKDDLLWWVHFLPRFNGVSIIKSGPPIDDLLFLSTDACLTGCGGFFRGSYFRRPFPGDILRCYGHDINIFELMTILVALRLWGTALAGTRFVIHCNNANSVFALTSGRTRNKAMQACLRDIWFLSAAYDFELTAIHIPGRANTVADHLSRWHLDTSHKARFEALTADKSGPLSITPLPLSVHMLSVLFFWFQEVQSPHRIVPVCHHPPQHSSASPPLSRRTPTLQAPCTTYSPSGEHT